MMVSGEFFIQRLLSSRKGFRYGFFPRSLSHIYLPNFLYQNIAVFILLEYLNQTPNFTICGLTFALEGTMLKRKSLQDS